MTNIEANYRKILVISWLCWCFLSVAAYLMTSTQEGRLLILLGVISVSCFIIVFGWYVNNLIKEYVHLNRLQHRLIDNANEAIAFHQVQWNDKKDGISDYSFLAVNEAFETMTGLKSGDILGKRVTEVLPELEERWLETYGEVVVRQKSITMVDHAKALGKYFKISAYPIDEDKFAVMFLDVTETLGAEVKMKTFINKAKKADAFKTQFLKDVNHRLRTPLNGMMGMAQLIDVQGMSEGNRELFDALMFEMYRSRNILNQIAEFANLKGGSYQISKGDLAEDVNLVCGSIRACEEMEVRKSYDDLQLKGIYYEREVMRRVLKALLNNTLEESRGRALEIVVSPDRRKQDLHTFLMIQVKDYGRPIDEEGLEMLLDKMYHDDFIELTREEGYTSLPLARELMRHIGGDLICSHYPEEALVFTMKLPYYSAIGA